MASAPSTPTTSAAEGRLSRAIDRLKCPVCLDMLDRPVQMTCGHVVCKLCHERLVENSATSRTSFTIRASNRVVQCPECRLISEVPDHGPAECYALKSEFSGAFLLFKEQVDLTAGPSLSDGQISVTCSMCRDENLKADKTYVCRTCVPPCVRDPQLHLICGSCALEHHKDHMIEKNSWASEVHLQAAKAQLNSVKARCQQDYLHHCDQVRRLNDQLAGLTAGFERELLKFDAYEQALNTGPVLQSRLHRIQNQFTSRGAVCKEAFANVTEVLSNISDGLNANSAELINKFRLMDSRDSESTYGYFVSYDDGAFTDRGRVADDDVAPRPSPSSRHLKQARRRPITSRNVSHSRTTDSEVILSTSPRPSLVIRASSSSNVDTEEEEAEEL